MTSVRFQLYLEPESAAYADRLMARYGWTATQLFDRLLRFYNATQHECDGLKVLTSTSGEEQAVFYYGESGEPEWIDAAPLAVDLVARITEGLTPLKGFPDLPTADVED